MIPKNYVDEYSEKVKDLSVFGVKLDDMSNDELKAIIVGLYENQQSLIKQNKRERDFLLSINRA